MTNEVMAIPSTPIGPTTGPSQWTYLQSSQARHWRFSARQMEKMRSDGNVSAQQRLAELWSKERSLTPVEAEPEASSSSVPMDFLSVEDEQTLIAYYLTRVRQLVKAFGLPEVVEATTITYIKRFYLRNTCMDYHPKNVMLTCLFLAAKAESNAVPLKHFAQKLAGKDPSQAAVAEYVKIVQDLEFLVSQSLTFEYTVYGAHRALHGLLLDLQMLQPKPKLEEISGLLAPSRANVQRSRFTDAELVFTPAQIAMACVYSISDASKQLARRLLNEKGQVAKSTQQERLKARNEWRSSERTRLERKGVKSDAIPAQIYNDEKREDANAPLGSSVADIELILQEICTMIDTQSGRATDSIESVKEIDKKLKLCQNPETMANSRIAKHQSATKNGSLGVGLLGKRAGAAADDDDDDDDDDEGIITANKRVKV